MTTSNQISTALLAEHFRYTPLTLLDDIINTVNELVFRAVNAVEEGLSNAAPENLGFKPSPTHPSTDALHEAKQNEVDTGIVQLESLLNATVDKDFDKFEIYTLRNILAVGHQEEDLAPWVQLDHYKSLDLTRSGRQELTPEEVQLQRRKLKETKKLNGMLKAEEARNAAVLDKLRQGLTGPESPFTFLMDSANESKGTNGKPLDQNVQYALSQLPALRQHLAQLKASTETALPNARHRELDEDSAEAKRRAYIDTQSRRALHRKGIEAESADGISAATGRKIGRDEVEGIEAVVQALGGAEALRRRRSGEGEDEMEE